jgi:steroid 5-alpha reductase family enzyme
MNTLADWAQGLPPMLMLAVLAWAIATARGNVGLVDIFWSLFLLVAAGWHFMDTNPRGPRATFVLILVSIWALRLAIYLAARNWHAPEDHRYQVIRARNQPGFAWKSFYLVFLLQALLAFIVSAPLYVAMQTSAPLNPMDALGALLVVAGFMIEAMADAQLSAFRTVPINRGRVLDTGLWRYSRHPNYFGEFCVWWGFGLIAAASSAWWTLASPLLMSVLLLRVSGVSLLEKDIGNRRPAYSAYVARTNAFFPGPRKCQ